MSSSSRLHHFLSNQTASLYFPAKSNREKGLPSMISLLAQERLLGATLGSALTGFVVFEQRKRIYESIAERDSQPGIPSQVKERIFGKKSRMEFASLWNKAVDQTFGPVIEFLGSRKW